MLTILTTSFIYIGSYCFHLQVAYMHYCIHSAFIIQSLNCQQNDKIQIPYRKIQAFIRVSTQTLQEEFLYFILFFIYFCFHSFYTLTTKIRYGFMYLVSQLLNFYKDMQILELNQIDLLNNLLTAQYILFSQHTINLRQSKQLNNNICYLILLYNLMMNPQSGRSAMLSPRLMFSYDRGSNQSWNMPEYKTPRIYQDSRLEVQKRKWAAQKKGQKSNKYVTKRGFYMDYDLKVSRSIPGSNVHQSQEPWSFKKQQSLSKFRKVDQKLKKNTYIQQIENQQQKRKKPGVGTYSLEKSLLQKQPSTPKLKQSMSKSQKRYFYQDIEHVSNTVPGSGNYSPHYSVDHTRPNKKSYEYWIGKHKKQFDRDHKRSLSIPTAGTYTPLSQSYQTFQNLLIKTKKGKKNGFGGDARFPYIRPDKKKIKEVRPSPNSYDTSISWRGKQFARKGKQWNEAIWKGSLTQSIYKR